VPNIEPPPTTIGDSTDFYKSRVAAIELANMELLIKATAANEHISKLQAFYNKAANDNVKLNSIIAIQSQTISAYKDSLKNQIVSNDTVGDTIYPTYAKTITVKADSMPFDFWLQEEIRLGYSTFAHDLKINNFYIVGTAKTDNWFHADTTYAYVTNLNPLDKAGKITYVTEVKPVAKKWISPIVLLGAALLWMF